MSSVKQKYKGTSDKILINTDYPNYDFELEIPLNSEIEIALPEDIYNKIQRQVALYNLERIINNERR